MPTKQQMDLDLIHHEENGAVIDQRAADGYINATAMCKAVGKEWSNYYKSSATKEFLDELGAVLPIGRTGLIHTIQGGVPALQGTWVHPQVATHLAQWLSPKFAVRVSKWVHDWLSGKGAPSAPAKLPHHLDRYLTNESRIPPGYFSILQETALSLIGPLHKVGFDIPKDWVPDISVGRTFCAWLRKNKGIDTDKLPVYEHDYLDGRQVDGVKLYPNDLLGEYRNWFIEVWLPEYGVQYFKRKDPGSVAYLNQLPALGGPGPQPRQVANKSKFKRIA